LIDPEYGFYKAVKKMLLANQEDNVFMRDNDGVVGRIYSVETMGGVDGPGIRYVLFLQGCMFRCKYCHNRDSWDLQGGYVRTSNHAVREIKTYKPFIKKSGGVTITGGEPLLQIEFVLDVFKQLKNEGLHTCLDTNGYVLKYDETLDELIDHTDLVMLDIKQIDDIKHKRLTEVYNHHTLKFAQYLADRNQPMWLRLVVVPGYSDSDSDVDRFAAFAKSLNNVTAVELLPYHVMGIDKWKKMDIPYPLEGVEPPSEGRMQQLKKIVERHGLAVRM
jgi:pyruvate formate lyase activating enzyme